MATFTVTTKEAVDGSAAVTLHEAIDLAETTPGDYMTPLLGATNR